MSGTRKILLMVIIVFNSCSDYSIKSISQTIGLADPPPLPQVSIDILYDISDGSPGGMDTVADVVDTAFAFTSRRPRSNVSVWILGDKGSGDTQNISAVLISDKSQSTSLAAWHEEQARKKADFLSAVRAEVTTRKRAKTSPLASGLSKIAFSRDPSIPTFIVLVSDGMEVSAIGDWECGVLPDTSTFIDSLVDVGLGPGALSGTTIVFAYCGANPIPRGRCSSTIARAQKIRRLWSSGLTTTGARAIFFSTSSISLESISRFGRSNGDESH